MKGRVLAVLSGCLALAGFSRANLVVNGGFENGSFSGDSHSGMALAAGSSALEGWEVFGTDIAWFSNANDLGLNSSEGTRMVDLSGYGDGPTYGGIRQTLATAAGQHYQLRFDLGVNETYGEVSRIAITCGRVDGDISLHLGSNQGQFWQTYIIDFDATSSFTLLEFSGLAPSSGFIGIDNVSVEAVPEPASVAGLTLGALVVLRRRRTSKRR